MREGRLGKGGLRVCGIAREKSAEKVPGETRREAASHARRKRNFW